MNLQEFKKELSAVIARFKQMNFKTVKTVDGRELSYEGETPEIGVVVSIEGAPAPDGSYEIEGGGTLEVKEGKIIDIKKVEEKEADLSEFEKYLDSDAYRKSEAFNPQEYPWDDCIAEQTAAGAECPECVCAAIKQRTVANSIEQGRAKTSREAVSLIRGFVKENAAFRYLAKNLNKKEMDFKEIEVSLSEIKKENADALAAINAQIAEFKTASETAEKKMNKFSTEILSAIEKLPGEPPTKPKEQSHKDTYDPLQKFKKDFLKQ